jgi:AcrR family transcriptional regulator
MMRLSLQSTLVYEQRVILDEEGVNRLDEQQCSTDRRRHYKKTKRAEDEALTRARIVDAAEALHGTLGPAYTSISAIAERASVTRATVYRHFPDPESLFIACSAQWISRQPVPRPDTWTHAEPLGRLREGLGDIYRYYRAGEQMLALIHRDTAAVPSRVAENRLTAERAWLTRLLEPFPGRPTRTVSAAVAHACAFSTWRSLCLTQGLSNRSAVGLMVGMVAKAHPSDHHPIT